MKAPTTQASVKPSVLCVASRAPGRCRDCRHANQGTSDFAEGHVVCRWDQKPRQAAQACDVSVALSADGSAKKATYFLSEPFDGENGTFDVRMDSRLLAEDADAKQRELMQARRPFIPAGE